MNSIKLISTLIIPLVFLSSCRLFDGDTKTPDFMLISPTQPGMDAPRVKIGSAIEVKAELTDNESLTTYRMILVRRGEERTPLKEVLVDIPNHPRRYSVDTLFVIPETLTPSQSEKEYYFTMRVEDGGGNTLGKGTTLFLEP